jgi:FAD dependent oxidoreductase TIGR03364
MHAWMARRAGWRVVLIDRHPEPRGATVRNFGLVWVSGRKPGVELTAALRARTLWEEIGNAAEQVGFRPDGSMTIVSTPEEIKVLEEVVTRNDSLARGFRLLDAAEARTTNPVLRGEFSAGLYCERDGVVEPREVLPALRAAMSRDSNGSRANDFTFVGGALVTGIGSRFVTDAAGKRHECDVVIVCTGAASDGPLAQLAAGAPLRRCRLQMMQTAPLGERLTTSLADGDSLRYYPAFETPAREGLPPRSGVAERLRIQLLVSQRRGGELTIGDTHDYDEPFAFDLEEEAYRNLTGRVEAILGRPLPPVTRRWAGVYSQVTDGGICWRSESFEGVWYVTGPGGRGMTLAPAIAEETISVVVQGASES